MAGLLIIASCSPAPDAKENLPDTASRPNVLFIAVDDLRPEFGAYGRGHIVSPNLDALANAGTLFRNAYCNVPVCGASRASILTGMRPLRDRFVDYDCRVDQDVPAAATLHGHFKANGYRTVGLGKIHHFPDDRAADWSEPFWRPDYKGTTQVDWRNYQSQAHRAVAATNDEKGPPWDRAAVPDNAYHDGQTTDRAVRTIARLADSGEPFFLAVGFLKPHLPFNAPEKYWQLYDPGQFTMPPTYSRAAGTPEAMFHNSGELRFGYHGVPEEEVLPEDYAINLIHGYSACVSYVDAQIGRLRRALAANGLADNTIIVLWGDHGYNLGDHTLWCKHTTFASSLRVPLLISAPGLPAGQVTEALAEHVDVFPTLCDLAGLPAPQQLEGESLRPYLEDANLAGKPAVFSRWKNADNVTTRDFSYTEWHNEKGEQYARALFDHRVDSLEMDNVAEQEGYAKEVSRLRDLLKK